jgi:hypothetical protein
MVTQICTPADDGLLICGTDIGSLALYDLQDFDSNSFKQDEVNYEALL